MLFKEEADSRLVSTPFCFASAILSSIRIITPPGARKCFSLQTDRNVTAETGGRFTLSRTDCIKEVEVVYGLRF